VIREKLDNRMQGSWWLGYKSDELNQIVDQAATTADLQARRELYSKAVDVLEADPPWMTLYHHTTFVHTQSAVACAFQTLSDRLRPR
jgi:peptide/nickel transport system substrate-binding protein